MKKIIVAGANGQLGQCLQKIAHQYDFEFYFKNSAELDITNLQNVEQVFEEIKPHFCINAAAYTAVDTAENNPEKVYEINAIGVKNLAEMCVEFGAKFIHISTDYVFDGETSIPYDEENFTAPLGVYGNSKRKGEEFALDENPNTIILRTSWLYSEFNKNFVKTMLNLFQQKEEIGVVADQFGQPTNANDLAEAIMAIITSEKMHTGIFHFSNYGETSWYEFAEKIAEFSQSKIKINPITTEQYPTPAKRPKRSTFSLEKIENTFGIEPKYWQNSLQECISDIIL